MVILLLSVKQSFGLDVNITKKIHQAAGTLYRVNFKKKLQLKIPEVCAKLKFCEDIPDFPDDQISQLIDLLVADNIHFNRDLPDEGEDKHIHLCRSESTIYQPKAVKVNDDWHIVLNAKNKIVQSFKGGRCLDELNGSCSELVTFKRNYYGQCVQNYMGRPVIMLSTSYEEVISVPLLLPSCCSCVASSRL
ncbi:unnamed protein product [Pieris brassicae]|uniref:Spaetzle domain-containing protein n=1 Tax=Pieris brassicae TaxID=7116 RepID=A0A9P0XHX8_PIEBR|nr:unnamed protein product [Pieris brassicae]